MNEKVIEIFKELEKNIVGQKDLLENMLIALLCSGHILLEGAPGLAKTLAVSSMANVLNLDFKRIQFTPDLLPSDLIGAKIYNPEQKSFEINHGPIFSNFVLADEINRAPSKVQSALLEAMAEKQVTIGDKSFKLKAPFIVLATMNPIEHDGTYSLPEAQLDRFLLKVIVDYPNEKEEWEIMKQNSISKSFSLKKILSKRDIISLQEEVENVFVDENIFNYVKDIIFFSRENQSIKKYLSYGASPRASIALIKTAKAKAFLNNRDYVLPEDIKIMAKPVLRHRLILNYEAMADDISTDTIIDEILKRVRIS